MKQLLNFGILFGVLFLGNMIVPECIVSDSWQTTLLAAVVCTCAECICGVLTGLLMIMLTWVSAKTDSRILFIATIVIVVAATLAVPAIGLLLCSKYVSSFAVNGWFTYVVLALLISLLSFSDSKKSE